MTEEQLPSSEPFRARGARAALVCIRFVWTWLIRAGQVLWACRISVFSAVVGLAVFGLVLQAQNLFADLSFNNFADGRLHWIIVFAAIFVLGVSDPLRRAAHSRRKGVAHLRADARPPAANRRRRTVQRVFRPHRMDAAPSRNCSIRCGRFRTVVRRQGDGWRSWRCRKPDRPTNRSGGSISPTS